VKHPRWIDLTLSSGADVPFLLKERDNRVRLLCKDAQFVCFVCRCCVDFSLRSEWHKHGH